MLQRIQQFLPGGEREPRVAPPQPLTPQAVELWKAVAPKRRPRREETAVFSFNFSSNGVRPETSEQNVFLNLLRRYNHPIVVGGNPFIVSLSVNPDPLANISFAVNILAPKPPELCHPVLTFTELPPRNEYEPLRFPYNMLIRGEGDSIYTEDCGYELMGLDATQGRLYWEEAQFREGWSSNPIGDVEYRRKFAGEALSFLTKVVLTEDPVLAAEKDIVVRDTLETARKKGIERWRSKTSFWRRILFEPNFYQPNSVVADDISLMVYRRRTASNARAAEYMRKYYPQSMQSSTA